MADGNDIVERLINGLREHLGAATPSPRVPRKSFADADRPYSDETATAIDFLNELEALVVVTPRCLHELTTDEKLHQERDQRQRQVIFMPNSDGDAITIEPLSDEDRDVLFEQTASLQDRIAELRNLLVQEDNLGNNDDE